MDFITVMYLNSTRGLISDDRSYVSSIKGAVPIIYPCGTPDKKYVFEESTLST